MSEDTPNTPAETPAVEDAAEATPVAANEVPGETPVQRALRLKKGAIDARPKPPRGGRFQREQNSRITAGKSRPWMTK